jgi:predicted metalloenzyme YecM
MTDPIAEIIGDYGAFVAQQADRLATRGIDVTPYPVSHLAYRVPEWDQYVHVRTRLERYATGSNENVWNGRPICLIVPAEPMTVLGDKVVGVIELIAPVHQRVYKMGMEHVGFVVGQGAEEFSRTHREVLTGQQYQSAANEPYYVLFEDFTHAKFHQRSLREVVELEGGTFDGFRHVEGWVPQALVTATGPNPLPR